MKKYLKSLDIKEIKLKLHLLTTVRIAAARKKVDKPSVVCTPLIPVLVV